jgi:hypothetical protein
VLDEVDDDMPLSIRSPAPVGGVVQWFRSASVASTHSGASCDEQLGEVWFMRGRCDVECRVAPIDVMANHDEEVFVWTSPAGADLNRSDCEIRR